MTELIQKKAELALLYAVPILSNADENSRLANLQRRLQKAVTPCLQKMPKFTNHDLNQMITKIHTWGKETGWLDDKKHISALVSFCVEMVETSPFKYPDKVLQTLTDLADHLEKGKKLESVNCSAGANAAEKWEELFAKEI